jgi:HAD superfamily hydrolase (TIGR01509 family)
MSSNGGVRGILLDLDGTIADSIDFFYGLAREMLEAASCAAPERSAVLDAIANGHVPHERFLPADFPEREAFLERIFREHWPTWIARYGSETEPLEGAVEVIHTLRERGLRLALVTSSSGPLPFLDRWGIRASFGEIIGRDDVRRIKPDPEGLLLALARLGLEPGQVLNVGDTPLDVRAGIAAGVETVGVLTGAGTEAQLRDAGAREVLRSLADLPDFLDRSFSGNGSETCATPQSARRFTRS